MSITDEFPPASDPHGRLEPGELVACRYRILGRCRSHPLGDLYRCLDETGGQVVLLQRLRREFCGPGVRDRLFDTRGSASLKSAVITDILDYGEDLDGRPFVVTPWSDDPSLDAVERPLGFHEAVAIVERVVAALAPLHARGLVHGGIEPASILVDGERELTSLLGFGLAPALDAGADKTRALPLLASPAYAAPELIRGVAMGTTADVYALGILLWELIFGAVPFRGPTLRVLDAHLNRPLPERELPFDAPASFAELLRRMLAKDPRERPSDAGAVLEQLRPYTEIERAPELTQSLQVLEIFKPAAAEAPPDWIYDEDDDDETVVFERVRPGQLEMPQLRLRAEIVDDEEPSPRPSRRRRWLPQAVAAVAMLGTLAMLGARSLASSRAEAASEVSFHARASAAMSSVALAQSAPVEPRTRAPAPQPRALPEPAPELPVELSKADFHSTKPELYRRVDRCLDGRARRTVKVSVSVDADGAVGTVRIHGDMRRSKLGRCVARQARRLEFPATAEGGRHSYTLRLR
jgi:serine/threonine protein kinase